MDNPKYIVKNTTNKQIGQKLKERRKSLHMTQKNLSDKIGCTFQQIQKYEAGINNISLPTFLKLCEVLQCKPQYFFSNLHFSDSNNTNDNYAEKTNLILDNIELQLILKFRQLPNHQIKHTIVSLLQDIIAIL